jgi:hypothetical protein
MVHPTDSELLALVHHESSASRRTILAHLASCEPCQLRYRTLAQQDGEIASLLTLLDAAPPIVPLAGIARRARLARRSRSVAAAAAILIAATAAATVIPGAPLHRYFHSAVGKPLPDRPALRLVPAPADTAGVTVASDTDVIIALREPQSVGEIHVVWQTGAPAVSVRAIGGDVGYTVRTGRVQIENRRPALRYEITLPPAIPGVTLMVGDKVVWQSIKQANAGHSRQPMTFDLSNMPPRK